MTKDIAQAIDTYASPFDEEGDIETSEPSMSGNGGYHWVDSYTRSDGTHVNGYIRGNPDGDPTNNVNYDGP